LKLNDVAEICYSLLDTKTLQVFVGRMTREIDQKIINKDCFSSQTGEVIATTVLGTDICR
jgi:hypothetical protein